MSSTTALSQEEANLQRQLGRIQIFAPLSIASFLLAALLATFVARPTLKQISDDYLTVLTPSATLIGLYWLIIAVLLFGQCLLLVVAKKEATRATLTHGMGLRLSMVNVLMAFWVLFWTLKLFLVAEIILFVALALAVSVWGTLIYHPPDRSRPFDYLFVHVPARMIVCVLFTVDIWQNGLLALGWYNYIGPKSSSSTLMTTTVLGKWEPDHTAHSWGAFGLVLGLALINAAIVFAFADIPWAASSIYLFIALAYHSIEKPPQVFITLILGAAMVFVALVSSLGWTMIKRDREGAIRLDEDAESEEEERLVRPGGVV